jgi:hypothetical protein
MQSRAMAIVLTFVLTITICFGGFLHAAIPHNDGDNHGQSGASPVWESLHSAIKHEDKKSIAPSAEFLVLLVLVLLLGQRQRAFTRVRLQMRHRHVLRGMDPVSGLILRRGIAAYRAFR